MTGFVNICECSDDQQYPVVELGTAPTDRGSAGNPNPAVNLKGNRKLNHAIHVVAITQIRNANTEGRALYERH